MSYGAKYIINFNNRENINCNIVLLLKDYPGYPIELTGAERPFTLKSQAQDNVIPYGIKATEATIEFYSDNLVSLLDFYSEDDTAWLAKFYYDGNLAWTGFLQLDNCSEQITDITHIISLNANDGLARLQTQYFLSTSTLTLNQPLIVNWTLSELVLGYLLPSVGLEIDVKAWLNIYENSTMDRNDFNYLTFFPQTAFSTKYFINDDGTTQTLYDALNNILIDFRCMLTQADGYWQIIRWGDVWLFPDGTMPGTLYSNQGGAYEEIIFPAALEIGRGQDNLPINENQFNKVLRPFQFSKETFNYEQALLLKQANLQIATGATPFDTHTDGDFRYDDYSIADYFPDWIQRNGDDSFLEVVTNIAAVPEQETDRYIYKPAAFDIHRGTELNPVEVSINDAIDFSLDFSTLHTDGLFYVRFLLIVEGNQYYSLEQDTTAFDLHVYWDGPFAGSGWYDTSIGVRHQKEGTANSYDQFLLSKYIIDESALIPSDGVLLIEIDGNTSPFPPGFGTYTTHWKSPVLTITNFLNQATQIIGQFHNTSQDANIRNNLQYEVVFDDTPSDAIKGTLFTDALTNFDETDTDTGEETDIGNVYFTRTAAWHRQGISEAKRLGDLNTFNDMFLQRVVRTIVEGDFFGLSGVHLLRLVKFSWLPTRKFIFGAASFDYMSCIWNATLYEIFKDEDIIVGSAFMSGVKNEDLSIVTGVVHFDSVTYYGGADGYISDSDTISKFTYGGSDRTIDLSVIFFVPISGSGTATFTIEKNGGVIATQTLNASAHFGHISFDIRGEAVTDGDYFQAFIDTGGADVDIQSGSINITVDGVIDTALFNYTFTYIYSAK